MRVRCRCGKLTTTRYACKSCGSITHQIHCHDRAHASHSSRGRAFGYENEDLGVCPSFTLAGLHLHPYNLAPGSDHRDGPSHYVGSALFPPIRDWLGAPLPGQHFR